MAAILRDETLLPTQARSPTPRILRVARATAASLLLLCASAQSAHASTETPFYGARSLSMGGAHRGLASGNDAVFVNQAAMAMERRYSAEAQYTTGGDHISRGLLSTVDSKTAAVAAGVAYGRTWGNPSNERPALNQFNMALAWAPMSVLSFGLGAVNVTGHFTENGKHVHLSHFDASLSAMVSLAKMLGVGITWENFIPQGKAEGLTPRALGVGAGLHTSIFSMGADMRFDMARGNRMARSVEVGGEVVLLQFLALRGGWRLLPDRDDIRAPRENVVTAGLASVLGTAGIEAGMEKALSSRAWRFAVGLQFSM